jgi:hypothetical protein
MYRTLVVFVIAMSSIRQIPRDIVQLPAPRTTDGMPLDQALVSRLSVREFASTPLTWSEIGQLLWAAQGITHDDGKRTAPSAGATYPLELFVATADGLFQYRPDGHTMTRVTTRDLRKDIRQAAGGQDAINAPAIFAFTAVPRRTAARSFHEAGHAVAPRPDDGAIEAFVDSFVSCRTALQKTGGARRLLVISSIAPRSASSRVASIASFGASVSASKRRRRTHCIVRKRRRAAGSAAEAPR